jgi:hypothetical protein
MDHSHMGFSARCIMPESLPKEWTIEVIGAARRDRTLVRQQMVVTDQSRARRPGADPCQHRAGQNFADAMVWRNAPGPLLRIAK